MFGRDRDIAAASRRGHYLQGFVEAATDAFDPDSVATDAIAMPNGVRRTGHAKGGPLKGDGLDDHLRGGVQSR